METSPVSELRGAPKKGSSVKTTMRIGNTQRNTKPGFRPCPTSTTMKRKTISEITLVTHMGTAIIDSEAEPSTEVCMSPTTPTSTKKHTYTGSSLYEPAGG